jgi:hypothetical protein
MKNSLLRFSLLGLLAVAMAGTPIALRAQNAPAAAPKKAAPRTQSVHGKLKAVDNTAKTLSVGQQTIQITSETKITKANKPATLTDGVVGEDVVVSYKKTADGKLDATTVRFGAKPAAAAPETKKEEKK